MAPDHAGVVTGETPPERLRMIITPGLLPRTVQLCTLDRAIRASRRGGSSRPGRLEASSPRRPGGGEWYSAPSRSPAAVLLRQRSLTASVRHDDETAELKRRLDTWHDPIPGALYEEWSRPGIAGHTHPVGPTPYKRREGSHVDPDGNVIRFGSPIEE
jgi:hypothetical protein